GSIFRTAQSKGRRLHGRRPRSVGLALAYWRGGARLRILAMASLQPALALSALSRIRLIMASRPSLPSQSVFMSAAQASRMAWRAACISGEGGGPPPGAGAGGWAKAAPAMASAARVVAICSFISDFSRLLVPRQD